MAASQCATDPSLVQSRLRKKAALWHRDTNDVTAPTYAVNCKFNRIIDLPPVELMLESRQFTRVVDAYQFTRVANVVAAAEGERVFAELTARSPKADELEPGRADQPHSRPHKAPYATRQHDAVESDCPGPVSASTAPNRITITPARDSDWPLEQPQNRNDQSQSSSTGVPQRSATAAITSREPDRPIARSLTQI